MRLNRNVAATVVLAVLLVPAFHTCTGQATSVSGNEAQTIAYSPVPAPRYAAPPLPAAPTPLTAMPLSSDNSAATAKRTPKVELFLGYSYLRSVPAQDANRLVWLNGGRE